MNKLIKIVTILIFLMGLGLRLWHLDFGLPHSWYADEPEIGEPAIKYTYELKNIIRNNDIYKLVPESFVYGTFPVYIYTLMCMLFSKTLNLLNISFSKSDLYIYMRLLNALISLAIIPVTAIMLRTLNIGKYKSLTILLIVFLTAFNWKFIVHAHYLNHDIMITLLILLSNLFFLKYLQNTSQSTTRDKDTLYTVFSALFFGLAVSTKITSLLTLPLYILFFAINKDYKNAAGFLITALGVFVITNPFSWLLPNNFINRIFEMQIKEAGMVFDSVDYNPFKYLIALEYTLTLPVLGISLMGIIRSHIVKDQAQKQFFVFMVIQIIFYLLFFTIQSRRVDRWMLPIIPNLILFAAIGLNYFMSISKKPAAIFLLISLILGGVLHYLYYPVILLAQFNRNTPKSASYIWAKEHLPSTSSKFGITEEGLDPLNKLPLSTIWQYNSYESNGAQFMLPPNVLIYDYVIVSSRPISWTSNVEVSKKYPEYSLKWKYFLDTLQDSTQFILINSWETTDPNLIPLSSVYIYKNVSGYLLK